MRPYTSTNNRPQNRPNTRPNNPSPAQPRPNHDRRPTTHQARPFQQQNRDTRPPFRPTSSRNTNQRRPPNSNNAARRYPSTSNTANIVCNNCGRLGHYANRCITANCRPQTSNNNRGGQPNRNTNNENATPRNQRAYFITDSTPSQSNAYHHQAKHGLL